MHDAEHAHRIVTNEPQSGWPRPDLPELSRHRELLWFLTWRDVKVRYKQTVLGAMWAILQPVFTMLIFTVVFSRLAKISSGGLPYPVFAYTALVPWTFFSNALTQTSGCLVSSERVITKVYFPRLVLPISSVLGVLVDLALAFLVLVVMLGFYRIRPTWAVAAVPLFVLLAAAAALGVGLFLAALNVRYRDIRYVIPFVVQAWLFVTPVAYATDLVPEQWRFVYGLNPMVGVVDGFRWALLGSSRPGPALWASILATGFALVSGLFFFRRLEDSFADDV